MSVWLLMLWCGAACAQYCAMERQHVFDVPAAVTVFEVKVISLEALRNIAWKESLAIDGTIQISATHLLDEANAEQASKNPQIVYETQGNSLSMLFELKEGEASAAQGTIARIVTPMATTGGSSRTPPLLATALGALLSALLSHSTRVRTLLVLLGAAAALAAAADAACTPALDLTVTLPPTVHRICNADSCICTASWSNAPACDIPAVATPTSPPNDGPKPCVPGQLGCTCLGGRCKSNQGDCVKNSCICTAGVTNCALDECLVGESGCACTALAECNANEVDVECYDLSSISDAAPRRACLSNGQLATSTCGLKLDCKSCAQADGCTWCGDTENDLAGACIDNPMCTTINIPQFSKSCQNADCCPVVENTPEPMKQCEPPQYYDEQRAGCIPCPIGLRPNTNGVACGKCAFGTYRNESMTSCEKCFSGQRATADRTGCVLCPAGQQQSASLGALCQACPAGHVREAGQLDGCKACAAGTSASVLQTACLGVVPGVTFHVIGPETESHFMKTNLKKDDQFCINGGFWMRKGDIDEYDGQGYPFVFSSALEKSDSFEFWHAITQVPSHETDFVSSMLLVCFNRKLVSGATNAKWMTVHTELQGLVFKELKITSQTDVNYEGMGGSLAPVYPSTVEIRKTSNPFSDLRDWQHGPCVMGGIIVHDGKIKDDGDSKLSVGVEKAGSSGWKILHEFPLEENPQKTTAGIVCFRGQLAEKMDSIEKINVPCGRGGVTLASKYSADRYSCIVHSYGFATDINEKQTGASDDDLLHAFTYVVGNTWTVAVTVRHRDDDACTAWASVLCIEHGVFEHFDGAYSVEKPSAWLEP